jgi:hypothetical protein
MPDRQMLAVDKDGKWTPEALRLLIAIVTALNALAP